MGVFYSEGNYWVKCVSQAMGASKNKGTPQFSLRVAIAGKVNPLAPTGDLIAVESGERTLYMYITEGTAERLCEDLQRIGFDKDSFKFLNPANENFHNFCGVEFEAYCKHEEYEGKTNEKWSIAFDRNAATAEPLEDKEVRKLDNLFGKFLKKKSAPEAEKEPPPKNKPIRGVTRQQQAATAASEDIPF